MDLKIKGISWAGNFYQKFEKVCNEVDNIVNQEAVKYVENQVQSVGENMKKFYSGVISDILPPSVSSAKHDPQEMSLEKAVVVDTHIELEMGTNESSKQKVNEQLQFEPSEFDPSKKQVHHALSGLHFADELSPLTIMDPLDAANSDQATTQISDALTNSNPNLKLEENSVKNKFCFDDASELTSPRAEDWFGDSLWGAFVDCNDDFSCQMPDGNNVATSVHGEEDQSNDSAKIGNDCSANNFKSVSDLSSPLRSTEMTSSIVSSEQNTFDADDFRIRSSLLESSLLENPNETSTTSVDVAGFSSHNNYLSSLSNTTLSTETKVSEMVSISSGSILSSDLPDSLGALRSTEMKKGFVVSFEENKVDSADVSNGSPLGESFLLENSIENSSPMAESCHSCVDVARLVSHSVLPSLPSTTTSFSEKVSEMRLMSSSSVLLSESIGLLDVSDYEDNVSSMESIDLYDEAKLEDSSVYVDNSALYAVSSTLRRHRSYKQMLRDAFTSKKRLAKEYEQLAIWFGDADMGSNNGSNQRPQTFLTTTQCEDLQAETDSGWEVL